MSTTHKKYRLGLWDLAYVQSTCSYLQKPPTCSTCTGALMQLHLVRGQLAQALLPGRILQLCYQQSTHHANRPSIVPILTRECKTDGMQRSSSCPKVQWAQRPADLICKRDRHGSICVMAASDHSCPKAQLPIKINMLQFRLFFGCIFATLPCERAEHIESPLKGVTLGRRH